MKWEHADRNGGDDRICGGGNHAQREAVLIGNIGAGSVGGDCDPDRVRAYPHGYGGDYGIAGGRNHRDVVRTLVGDVDVLAVGCEGETDGIESDGYFRDRYVGCRAEYRDAGGFVITHIQPGPIASNGDAAVRAVSPRRGAEDNVVGGVYFGN